MSKIIPETAAKPRSAAQSDQGRSFFEIELPPPPYAHFPYSNV